MLERFAFTVLALLAGGVSKSPSSPSPKLLATSHSPAWAGFRFLRLGTLAGDATLGGTSVANHDLFSNMWRHVEPWWFAKIERYSGAPFHATGDLITGGRCTAQAGQFPSRRLVMMMIRRTCNTSDDLSRLIFLLVAPKQPVCGVTRFIEYIECCENEDLFGRCGWEA